MLVVDRVELVALKEPDEVGELEGGDAVGRQQRSYPGHEIVEVRDLGEDIVADHQVGASVLTD